MRAFNQIKPTKVIINGKEVTPSKKVNLHKIISIIEIEKIIDKKLNEVYNT